MSDKESCGWQGFGFNAIYEDAGCVAGFASDLDNCESGEDGPLIAIGDEQCPQCSGIGKALGFKKVGVMALHRQRELDAFEQMISCAEDEDLQKEMLPEIRSLFTLILKLEKAE